MSRSDSGAAPDAVPETSHVEIPYWLKPAGAAFERAWATDRRAELAEILADAYRTGYQRGIDEVWENDPLETGASRDTGGAP